MKFRGQLTLHNSNGFHSESMLSMTQAPDISLVCSSYSVSGHLPVILFSLTLSEPNQLK